LELEIEKDSTIPKISRKISFILFLIIIILIPIGTDNRAVILAPVANPKATEDEIRYIILTFDLSDFKYFKNKKMMINHDNPSGSQATLRFAYRQMGGGRTLRYW